MAVLGDFTRGVAVAEALEPKRMYEGRLAANAHIRLGDQNQATSLLSPFSPPFVELSPTRNSQNDHRTVTGLEPLTGVTGTRT